MADATVKHHDYHLVAPSPWPFVGSVSIFFVASGAVMWMKHLTLLGFSAGPFFFFAGLIGLLYTMASWWIDVLREA
ncbi:cytochrome c oxidase subunit 3, partial [Enterococcus faecium]